MLRRYSHVFTVVKVFVGAHKRMTRELRLGIVRGRNVDSSISFNHVLPIREADGINDELNPVHLYSNDHE